MQDTLQPLFRRRRFGIKLGLDLMEALCAELGHPERAFASVHVAGTNGKGSVCALLESILRHAGVRTGLYISPHLVRCNERFVVAGEEIGDAALRARLGEVEAAAARAERAVGREATFFEFVTAMAFKHFAAEGVQMAVVETGLGGRLDATNVLRPVVSVITRIALEHTRYLGPDLESIAREKGGIIKPGRPVVLGAMDPVPLAVLEGLAAGRGSPCVRAEDAVGVRALGEADGALKVAAESASAAYGTLRLPLAGAHQVQNLATALAAVDVLRDTVGLPVDPAAVRAGVAATRWPGRCQVLRRDPLVIADGAHNPDAAAALAAALGRLAGRRPLALVAGLCEDKDADGFFKAFAGRVQRLWLVPLVSERSMPPDRLRAAASVLKAETAEASVPAALAAAEAWAREAGGVVCVTGSLFLVGEVLAAAGGAAPDPG